MGHRCGRAGERLGAAKADREVGDLQRVEEGERLFLAALQIEREGRAGAGAMALKDVRLARSILEETEIADLLDLRMAAQEIAYLLGILAGAVHSKLERFEAAQEHPRSVRVADGADRVADHP